MWNLCSSSKLVSDREKKRSYDIHKEKLGRMKPKMKIIPPSQPDFVYAKHKLQMSRRDRLLEIDHQNQILLAKMKKISVEDYNTNKLRPQAQNLKTLNQHVMNQKTQEIFVENKRICQKLLKVPSYYPTIDIVDKTDNLEQIRFNISQNARRVKSVTQLRPHSSITYRSKFQRSKVGKFEPEEGFYSRNIATSTSNLRPQSAPDQPFRSRPYSSEHKFRSSKRKEEKEENMEEEIGQF